MSLPDMLSFVGRHGFDPMGDLRLANIPIRKLVCTLLCFVTASHSLFEILVPVRLGYDVLGGSVMPTEPLHSALQGEDINYVKHQHSF